MLSASLNGMVAVFDPDTQMWMLCRGTVETCVIDRGHEIELDPLTLRIASNPKPPKLHLELTLTQENYVTAEWMRHRGWQMPDERAEIDPARAELRAGHAELEAGHGGDAHGS